MKQQLHPEIPQLAKLAQLGYVVAEVEYRHSGIAHHPAQIIDAKNAIRYMKKHAAYYHADPEKSHHYGGFLRWTYLLYDRHDIQHDFI